MDVICREKEAQGPNLSAPGFSKDAILRDDL